MAYKRKTWAEKMNPDTAPKVEITDKHFADVPEGATMLIATPTIVEEYVKHLPEGTNTTLQQMRKDLAAEYKAQYACPITTGMFLRIVSEKAYDEYKHGKDINEIAPFWRIVGLGSNTAKRLSFGTDFLAEQRRKEGLTD